MNELEGKRRMDAETALRLVELRARPVLPRGNPYGMGDRIAANAVQASSAAGDATAAHSVSSTNVPQQARRRRLSPARRIRPGCRIPTPPMNSKCARR